MDKSCIKSIQDVACNVVTGERMANVALQCINKTPDLAECDPKTLISALKTLAMMGCEPDGIHGYLVPHRNRKEGTVTATPIPSARGLMRMARANGVGNINIGIVRQGDSFTWKIQNGKFIMSHEEAWPSTGEPIGYYCTWTDKQRVLHGVRMTKAEVDAIRNRSRAADNGPWVTDPDQMALKTVIKRAAKQWDLPTEAQQAMKDADDQEFARDMRNVTPARRDLRLELTPATSDNYEWLMDGISRSGKTLAELYAVLDAIGYPHPGTDATQDELDVLASGIIEDDDAQRALADSGFNF